MSLRGSFSRVLPSVPRPRTFSEGAALGLIAGYVALTVASTFWVAGHYLAIRRLSHGVGDTVFLAADGRPWFALNEQRHDVPLDEISPHLRHAVVAVEDHRFYFHPGIDPIALARAMVHNLRQAEMAEGGSTLTQQLARILFLSNRRSWVRKAKEAALAVMLESALTKDQILELYLNRVYLGGGAYGAEAMSRKLFGKRARDLTLAESALIAGLIRAPSALSPWSNPDGAGRRTEIVLTRMREEKYITPEAEHQARSAGLRISDAPDRTDTRSGYAKEFVRQQFRERVGDENPADWAIRTTFVPELQQAAEDAVSAGLEALGIPGLQAALVALDPDTGDVLALVGGSDFGSTPFNRAVNSRRQPGSAFKPFVYAAGLEKGLSPVSVLSDLRKVSAGGQEEWAPRNAGHQGPDSQTLREALFESNNQAVVALQQRIGSGEVLKLGSAAGLRDLPDVPSLALGTGLVSPLELTAAYAVFPSGGLAVRPRAIIRALDAKRSVAFENRAQRQRVLSRDAAFQALTILQDVIDRGTGSAARSLGLDEPAGGKTGTTDDFRDAWFVGFTSSVVAGVWVGFDQPASIGPHAYAAEVALPIWVAFMRRASRVRPAEGFAAPPELREQELCQISYLRPLEGCPTYLEYFKKGDAVPSRRCPLRHDMFEEDVDRGLDDMLERIGRRLRRALDW